MSRADRTAMASAPNTSNVRLTRIADHPRFLETVVGRLLDLVVYSVEGVRERVRGRITVH
jgi:hypothetical protein